MENYIAPESPQDESEEENLPDYFWAQEENIKDDEFPFGDTAEILQYEDAPDEISDSFDSDYNWPNEQYKDQDEAIKAIRHVDKVRTFQLRKTLNKLDSFHQDKEVMISKIREELSACRQRIQSLEEQKTSVEMDIQTEQQTNNMAAVFRLQALHRRLSAELVNEEDMESKIASMLRDNEYDLWQIDVEQGKFTNLRKRLQLDEEELDRQNRDSADQRAQREKMSLALIERKKRAEKLEEMNKLKKEEQRYRKAAEEAQKNHERAVQFLKETMTRVHEKETEKEKKSREDLEKRMQAVLSLKNNISLNRENLRVIESRNKAQAAMAKKKELLEKEAVLARGGDVTKFIIHQKRLQEFEKQKKEFEESQKIRKQEIISRILKEEDGQEKQKKQTSSIERSKSQDHYNLRAKTMQYIQSAIMTEPDQEPVLTKKWRSPSPESSDEDDHSTSERSPDAVPELPCELEEESESLAQPEFLGLWNQDYKPYKVPKEDIDTKPLFGSKMEREIMTETLRKLRSGIVEKQVVSGHEFKGCPFYSKPKFIHFKDLDVGKTYKKKVTLTNASYTINFCKLVGVSDHLKDFITIQFDPPGQMSAGMSCDMIVIFKPMINEDLEGEVMFLAQAGPFSIPVKCTTKKCELALDKTYIDFGTHVIGETVTQIITLTNRGALGTRFCIRPLTRANDTQKTPLVVSSEQTISPTAVDHISQDTSTHMSLESTDQELKEILKSNQMVSAGEEICSETEKATSAKVETITPTDSVSEEPPVVVGDEHLQEDSQEEFADFRLGEATNGEIGPFTSVKIPVIFTPSFPGIASAMFEITFENQSCKAIPVTATGAAIDVPVYVPNANIDLKICTYDRLYQDSIVVKNRATTALRLKFEVCKELKNHMELLPKTGFIQTQSSFSVQLKFLPRHTLSEDASSYFDKETGVLEVPMTISVVDQTRLVPFTVHAVVTSSDIEISPNEVDFEHCTIFEAVQTSIHLTNKSILPQEFGFVGIPEYIDIQPHDGFGTLLPLETMKLDIIFKAPKAGEYNFDLTCKSAINRQFKISCKAVGVHPPMELSHYLVQFPATALNDASTATLYVVNSHTSRNEFTHPVPRIGKGEIAPVGPTSFQLQVPKGSPISISPSVGTVLPGKRCMVQVSFKPTLLDQEIREETMRMLRRTVETRALLDTQATPVVESDERSKKERRETSSKKDKKKQLVSPKIQKEKSLKSAEHVPVHLPKIEDIKVDSDMYAAARHSIYRRFTGKFDKYVIPCFIANCDIGKRKDDESLNFSPHNTLYLELHCPAVAPPLIVSSQNGQHLVHFGETAIGQRVVKTVILQNISSEPLKPRFSVFNTSGPFVLLNPVGIVEPGGNCRLLIAFSPDENQTLNNTSTMPVNYSIKLGSLSVTRYDELQKLPNFIYPSSPNFVGPQNYNGRSVFSVTPVEGIIHPDKAEDFTICFTPDHESVQFSDILRVELFSKHIAHSIHLKGASRNHIMFVEGGDLLDVPTESLSLALAHEGDSDKAASSLLLTLQCVQTEDELRPAVSELHVGCIRTSLLSMKKNVEFTWDNVQLLQQKGFTLEPMKAVVDAGQRKTISVSWIPPAGYDPSKPATTTAKLTLKGDVIETYQIIFITEVVSL
ncbi:cilia- and flagella-associated protein 74 isoform X2 [Mixophyes fleayi]|uniref:cilia- and flagella-associated protein 74 isoform X2 n=1 Tax=Mixophyes fleayi TaxID=3061075 RepID=UPI003F4DB0FF